ncbi:MAG: family 20 glycosylhydrolase [Armatimonadetes bacterium]|nr:family 20 glycosylhydrolase [Armatimonadota bacterium]
MVGLSVLVALAMGYGAVAPPDEVAPIAIVPEPVQWDRAEGSFKLAKDTPIVVAANESGAYGVAYTLAESLKTGLGETPKVHVGAVNPPPPGAITLTTSGADLTLGEEGYELKVTANSALVRAPTDTGLARGIQSLRQLLPPEFEEGKPRASWQIPGISVRDWPRYRWRGMLLDSCRHFYSKDFVKRAIDLLAYHKMNVLHWHLTEDQGWRIEIKKYPKLTEVGAFRQASGNDQVGDPLPIETGLRAVHPDPGQLKESGKYGGFYTQAEIKEIVAYAAARRVAIVPEIEMPGHALAALATFPELSCTGGPFQVGNEWGVYSDVYCAGNDKVFEFLQDVLNEVIDLFPGTYIHIGGDEVPKQRWQACAKCQARMKAEGLAGEHELQSWFIKRIDKFLTSRGKRLIGWDEILEGGLSPGATVQSWRSFAGGIAAARAGHDVIMSPTSHCYLDAPNESTTLERVYSFEPMPAELEASGAKFILGGEGNLWSERIPQGRWDRQAFPRLSALSEVLWSPREKRVWDDFEKRIDPHLRRLFGMGVRYYVPPPVFIDTPTVFTERTTAAFKDPVKGAALFFTRDGSLPTAHSSRYAGPIEIAATTRLRAVALYPNGVASESVSRTFRKEPYLDALSPAPTVEAGVDVRYFEGTWLRIPEFSAMTPAASGVAKRVGLELRKRDFDFALEFTGYLSAPADGIYTFFLESDDGSVLWVDGKPVVNNDGIHPPTERSGQVALRKGFHTVRVGFFQGSQALVLNLKWAPPGGQKSGLDSALFRAVAPRGGRR